MAGRVLDSSGGVLALLAFAACGPAPVEPQPVQRLALFDPDAESTSREPRTVASWGAEALAEDAEVVAGNAALAGSGSGPVLALDEATTIKLSPGLSAGAFDRARLEIRVREPATIEISGFAGADRSIGSKKVQVGRGLQEVEVLLPWTHRAQRAVDRLEIRATEETRVGSLELLGSAPEAWLPALGVPDLVDLGRDVRPAVGLGSRPVVAEFEARAGQRLVFAHGVPRELVRAAVVVGVEFRLERVGADPEVRELECPYEQWATEVVPIERDGRYRAQFRISEGSSRGALAALAVPVLERPVEQPPVLVLLTLDTYRADHVGLAGAELDLHTPALDALARRGAFFEDCLSSSNTTNPSHVSLMTGLPIRDHRVIGNDIRLSNAAPTLAEALASAGWRTWAAVSIPHVGTHSGLGQGFDRMAMPDGFRPAAETVAQVERWLEEPLAVPTFLWLHVFDPHTPYRPEPDEVARYWPADRDPYDETRRVEGWEAPSWAWRVTDPEYLIALYRAEVTGQDAHLRRVFEHPRLERAVWAVVGDHGEHMLSWQGNFKHGGLAPATLNVPLVLAGPGVPEGLRVARPVSSLDLGRTLLDLTGHAHLSFPGENLLVEAEERGAPERFAIAGNANGAAVRSGPWLLLQSFRSRSGDESEKHRVRLFDVERDPEQLDDRSAARPELTRELRTRLVEWLTTEVDLEVDLAGAARSDPETVAELAALGYAESGGLPGGEGWIDPECACTWCARFPLLR